MKWTPEMDQIVANGQLKGKPASMIAQQLSRFGSVSRNAVIGRVTRYPSLRRGIVPFPQIETKPAKAPPVKRSNRAIVSEYLEAHPGSTMKQITEATGLTRDQVGTVVQALGLSIGKVRGKQMERVVQFCKAHPGYTRRQVAQALGLDRGYVNNVVRQKGLPVRAVKCPEGGNVIPFPSRPVEKQRIKHPQLRVVSNNTDLMISDWLAKHGVRRFEAKVSSDYFAVQEWLRDRGYELVKIAGGMFRLNMGRGRPRNFGKGDSGWKAVVSFVDDLREQEGLPTFGYRPGSALDRRKG